MGVWVRIRSFSGVWSGPRIATGDGGYLPARPKTRECPHSFFSLADFAWEGQLGVTKGFVTFRLILHYSGLFLFSMIEPMILIDSIDSIDLIGFD